MTKILVIEDEAMVRASIVDLLKMEDYQTFSAENGLIGFGLAKKELPDLIICDVMMPELDGYGVLELLHQDPRTETIPFIFLTAKADKDDLRQGMKLGADDYVTKPFSCDELLDAINTRLNRRASFSSQYQQKLEDLRQNLSLSLPQQFITPLSIILMSSEVILQRQAPMEEEDLNDVVSGIQNAGNRLHTLINKFLIYSELEHLAILPEKVGALRSQETAAIKEIVTKVAQETALKAGRQTDLRLELHDTSARISEEWLTRLLSELIDNAFRYSWEHTVVRVINVPNPRQFILYITDSGRGIAPEYISNLGSSIQFEQALSSREKIGLGLATAHRIVELHNGSLNFESIPGQKTIVRITLPR